jgi:hypothetical protein
LRLKEELVHLAKRVVGQLFVHGARV